MKRVQHSAPVSLFGVWDDQCDDEVDMYFPVEWRFGEKRGDGIGGKCPDAIDTIYLLFPAGEIWEERPAWSITLTEMVDRLIGDHQCGDGTFDEDSKCIFRDLAESLRLVAQRLDDAANNKK